MKNTIYIFTLSLILTTCSQENSKPINSNKSNNYNLQELNLQKAKYNQKINELNFELEKIMGN